MSMLVYSYGSQKPCVPPPLAALVTIIEPSVIAPLPVVTPGPVASPDPETASAASAIVPVAVVLKAANPAGTIEPRVMAPLAVMAAGSPMYASPMQLSVLLVGAATSAPA